MSVFRCNVTYKRVEGDSYTSTYNKLLAHGFIDKYLNVKTDVATWRKSRSELNERASARLGMDVNLFAEKKLLNGIRAVPDMKLFGMIDSFRPSPSTEIINDEPGINEQGDSDTNNLDPLVSKSTYQRIYESIGQKLNSVIPLDKVESVQPQIDTYNQLNTGKVLSLQRVGSGMKIKTEFKPEYLYTATKGLSQNIEEDNVPTDSNNNFALDCIKGSI